MRCCLLWLIMMDTLDTWGSQLAPCLLFSFHFSVLWLIFHLSSVFVSQQIPIPYLTRMNAAEREKSSFDNRFLHNLNSSEGDDRCHRRWVHLSRLVSEIFMSSPLSSICRLCLLRSLSMLTRSKVWTRLQTSLTLIDHRSWHAVSVLEHSPHEWYSSGSL